MNAFQVDPSRLPLPHALTPSPSLAIVDGYEKEIDITIQLVDSMNQRVTTMFASTLIRRGKVG